MITDSYNRKHDYLRISLTDVCNLRCTYCMPDEHYAFMQSEKLMQPKEIADIAATFVSMGVRRIRLTGGEPLARRDFQEILQRLSDLSVTLTLTTNGTLLHRHLDHLINAGVTSLNISLDTLSQDKYRLLTRRDQFVQTMRNILTTVEKGIQVKINVVVMKGVNDEEILDFIGWTKHTPIEVRFIEFMPFEGNGWSGDQVVSENEILSLISKKYPYQAAHRPLQSTSNPYTIPGHAGSFAVISTMSAPFCAGCNRMRLTADGRMKNCLFSKGETDLLAALREGLPLKPLIEQNIFGKAEKLGGQFGHESFREIDSDQLINRSMISIGG
ncbi:MAG: GTP 3',8-cyclase MoaA [Chitinophagaceae bacterium]|nr:GTP 3',8-cyclase MoaA [Chitinophagaceae bacterium]